MTRAQIFSEVHSLARYHSSQIAAKLQSIELIWLNRPWDLPNYLTADDLNGCRLDLKELRYNESCCTFADCHPGRNDLFNALRAAWKRDQENWESERRGIQPDSNNNVKEIAMNPAPSPLNTIAETVKRNALTAAKRTAAKGVKDSARKAICAAAQASDNPALKSFAAMLESPHADAVLGVLVGVTGMMALPMLPDKVANSSHVTELFNNLQTSGFEHFGNTAYTEVAEPIITAIAGELMGYVAKMAALEAPAKPAELPGTENHGTEVLDGF